MISCIPQGQVIVKSILSEILMVKKGRSDATPFLTNKISLNIPHPVIFFNKIIFYSIYFIIKYNIELIFTNTSIIEY